MEGLDKLLYEEDMALKAQEKERKEEEEKLKKANELMLKYPKFGENNTTLIKSVLNKELWRELGDRATA